MNVADRIRRHRRASEIRLAEKLAKRGYVKSARALIKRQADGPSPIIEITRTRTREVKVSS